MNLKTKTALRFGVSALIVLLAAGCDQSHKSGVREWKTNKDGVSYNMTCIDSRQYIATPGSHGEISLAGPVGDCS